MSSFQLEGAGDDLALYMEDTRARHRPLAHRGLGAVLVLAIAPEAIAPRARLSAIRAAAEEKARK